MRHHLLQARDWCAVKLGYRRIYYVNYDPPNHTYKEAKNDNGESVWVRPDGVLKTEVVMVFNWRARWRLLLSGKVQVVSVVWMANQPDVAGDVFNWVVIPPYDKVDPKLKV